MEKLRFLTEPWCPPTRFEWPYIERKDRGNPRRKYLGPQHFTGNVDVLSYSLSKCGIYCRPCAIFAPNEVRRMNLNRIVKTPLQKYTHLTGKNGYLKKHLSKQLHEDSLSRSNAFVSIIKSNAGDVEQQGKVGAAKQREKNRRALERIIFPSSFWSDWAFLFTDTVLPVLCLRLKRVRRTLTTRREIFEQCCNSWQRVTTKLFTSTSEMLEGIPPISRRGFKMMSWMPWARV